MDLRTLRLEQGWSQEQLAEISGLSARTIQRVEKGETAGLETLKALASAFDMSLSRLQDETPDNEDIEPMSHRITKIDAPLIPKRWRGFLLHLLTFMVVETWLLILTLFFPVEQGFIYLTGSFWALALIVQAWNIANPDAPDDTP